MFHAMFHGAEGSTAQLSRTRNLCEYVHARGPTPLEVPGERRSQSDRQAGRTLRAGRPASAPRERAPANASVGLGRTPGAGEPARSRDRAQAARLRPAAQRLRVHDDHVVGDRARLAAEQLPACLRATVVDNRAQPLLTSSPPLKQGDSRHRYATALVVRGSSQAPPADLAGSSRASVSPLLPAGPCVLAHASNASSRMLMAAL